MVPGGHTVQAAPSFLPWHGSYDHSFVVLVVGALVVVVVVGALVVVVVVVLAGRSFSGKILWHSRISTHIGSFEQVSISAREGSKSQ